MLLLETRPVAEVRRVISGGLNSQVGQVLTSYGIGRRIP